MYSNYKGVMKIKGKKIKLGLEPMIKRNKSAQRNFLYQINGL